jgi:hypothetical protein
VKANDITFTDHVLRRFSHEVAKPCCIHDAQKLIRPELAPDGIGHLNDGIRPDQSFGHFTPVAAFCLR